MALLNPQSAEWHSVANGREEAILQDPVNINISAHRVLFLLLMLVRYQSLNVEELNRHLFEHPFIQRAYPSETITKYINTLREVGCMIPRSTARNDYSYALKRHPFPMGLNEEEYALLEHLWTILSHQPNVSDYKELWEQLRWCCASPFQAPLSESVQELPDNSVSKSSGNLPLPLWLRKKEDYQCYQRYCQEAYTVELYYFEEGEDDPVYLLLEPYELLEQSDELVLLGQDKTSQKQRRLSVDRILWSRQLSSKNHRSAFKIVVVFALYGRLAKSYRPYPGERIVFSSETALHVKTRVSDTTPLIRRILKYGESCEILSPDNLREYLQGHLQELLNTLSIV